MPKDFKASQIRTSALVGSGTNSSKPGLLIYSASDATNFEGGYQADMLTNVGDDVFLFVSGAKNSRSGVSLFGGDVVVSGTLYMERLVAEVDLTTTGSSLVSGSMFVSGGLTVNDSRNGVEGNGLTVYGDSEYKTLLDAAPDENAVYFLSGGAASSYDETTGLDVAFYVSGTVGGKDGSIRSVAVFGGDVVISGSLTDGDGNPIVGGGGGSGGGVDSVGWFSGSSAVHGDLGVQPNYISTSGSLAVTGTLNALTDITVGTQIAHDGDDDTRLVFGSDIINVYAGNAEGLRVDGAQRIVDVNNDQDSIDFRVRTTGKSDALKILGASGRVLILSGGAASSVDEATADDVGFYVSGSIGSRGEAGAYPSTALFGGDLVVSGGLHVSGSTSAVVPVYIGSSGDNGGSDPMIEIRSDKNSTAAADTAIKISTPTGMLLLDNAGDNAGFRSNTGGRGVDFNVNGGALTNPTFDVTVDNSTSDFSINLRTNDGGIKLDLDATSGKKIHMDVESEDADSIHLDTQGGVFIESQLKVDIDATQDVDIDSSNNVTLNGIQVLIHSGGAASSYDEASGLDVAFYVSGSIDSVGTSTRGVALFGGDLALSGALYGVTPEDGTNNNELAVVSDVITFSSTIEDPENLGSEVFFYVSGAAPTGNSGQPRVALFDGRLISSGNIRSVQNYPRTGSHLVLNNMTTTPGEGGYVTFDIIAGQDVQTGDGTKFTIQKAGPNNPYEAGGPYANLLFARSGSLILSVGNDEDYDGNQNFLLRDSLNTNFMFTTGSAPYGNALVTFLTGALGFQAYEELGHDVNFFVSGAFGSQGTSNRGTSLFGGDVVTSGSLHVEERLTAYEISGSLTNLTDGTSYLVAGDNVTITSASNGSITISATGGGGGSLAVSSGSTDVSSVTGIDFSRLGYVMNLGSGEIAVTGTIGLPEDGTYSDGLFTTFDSHTEIGHAIDKINEVLYYLAPSPAPNLSNIGNDGLAGTSPVLLSIGSTSTAGTSGYTLVGGSAGFGAAVDINETYQVATSSNNIRMGVFTSLQDITGDLADNVSQNAYSNGIINYSGSAFGDADQGTLKLEINGSVVQSVDLSTDAAGTGQPGSGTGEQLDGNNNGFFQLSQTGSSVQSNGQEFGLFKYRTGKFRVATGGGFQRTGWNYARVIQTVGGTDRTTNYIEWFNDTSNNGDPIVSNAEITNYNLGGSKFISGIEYATGAEGQYLARIDRFYDNVYQTNSITFGTTNVETVGSQTVPVLSTDSDSRLDSIHLTASFQVSETGIESGDLLSGSTTFNFSVSHPTKTNMVSTGSVESLHFLLFSGSSRANDQFEDFIYEDKRLVSASHDTQANLAMAVGSGYNSQFHVTSSEFGYGDGLVFFGGKLKAPVNTTNGGDFTSFPSSTSRQNGAQPDYSGLSSGTRTFFRAFRNESGAAANNFQLTLTGSGTTIVHTGTALGTGNVRVFVKNPENTGYLDLGQAFKPVHETGGFQVLDYDGLRIGSTFNDSVSGGGTAVNFGSFGTGSLANNDYMVLKIEADAAWTGDLEGMDVIFPAFDPSSVSQAPALDEIDITTSISAPSAKLSFGAGKTSGGPSNYINVTGSSGAGGPYGFGTDVDYNGTYSSSTNVGANKRYGVNSTNLTTPDITGNLNGDVSQSGQNYSADAFRLAHTGTLSLYVNASGSGVSPIHSVDLATFPGAGNPGSGTGTSVNAQGSGFIELSIPAPAKSSGGLEDFRYFHRTGKFKVAGADQNSKGWNWVRVVHSVEGLPDSVTTFVEWVNDDDGNAIDVPSSETGSMGAPSYYYQSGVKYFNPSVTTSGSVNFRVADAYTNVYSFSSTALQFSLSNATAQSMTVSGSAIVETLDSSLTSNGTSLPDLTETGDVTADIFVTGAIRYTGGQSLPGDASPLSSFDTESMTVTLTAKHPIDSNASRAQVFNNFLSYSGSAGVSNINTVERFTGEFFRAQSGSFSNQSAADGLGWDSTESLVGADAGHNTGLIVYGNNGSNTGYLISPKSSALPNGGDFRTATDLTSPLNNVNYTGATGERHFFRTFKNNTTSDQAVITMVVKGDATLVPRTGSGSALLGSNKNVYIFVKIPGKTGWLDVAKAADGTITDGGGALQGDRDATIDAGGASNEVTFSTAFIGGDPSSDGSGEHFCIAIHADADWTGYINEVSITY